MIDPEDQNYVCTLTEYSLEKAKRELFEDPKQRLGAVQTLRAWIKSQPHLTTRMDTDYLLQVLRTAKYSQLRAREIVTNLLTLRGKYPKIFANIDTHEPGIMRYFELGIAVPFPKPDKEGRHIMLFRAAMVDPSDHMVTPEIETRVGSVLQAMLGDNNENAIVNGSVMVMDLTNASPKLLTRGSAEHRKIHTKFFQECSTGRFKGFHVYNGGTLLEMMFAIMRPLLKKKYNERMYVHDTMESLYKVIPMELWPDEYLPDEYKGPSAGPIDKLVADLRRRASDPALRARVLEHTSDKYKVDESKRPREDIKESFRKLNTD